MTCILVRPRLGWHNYMTAGKVFMERRAGIGTSYSPCGGKCCDWPAGDTRFASEFNRVAHRRLRTPLPRLSDERWIPHHQQLFSTSRSTCDLSYLPYCLKFSDTVVPMTASFSLQPSFHLCPDFSIAPPPNGQLELGSVLRGLDFDSVFTPLDIGGTIKVPDSQLKPLDKPSEKAGFSRSLKELRDVRERGESFVEF
ncbi:major facilitator superfamily mfs-1 [Ilyonectria robusta]